MVVSKTLCNIKDTRVNEACKRVLVINSIQGFFFGREARSVSKKPKTKIFHGIIFPIDRLIILLELFQNLQVLALYSENITCV